MNNVDMVKSDVMKKIKEAADSEQLLLITYADAKNQPSIRTVEPYEIKNGKLFAYCRAREAIRAFNLERIQAAEIHLGSYTPRFPILI